MSLSAKQIHNTYNFLASGF